LLPILAACAAGDPGARVEELRTRHTATLQGFVVRQQPAEALNAAAPAAEGESLVAPPPAVSDVVLDLTLRRDSDERLSGITLEVGLVDPRGKEKEHYRIWIATPTLERGTAAPVSYALEDVAYQAGDVFVVEVRAPVPAAERALYREFAGGA
jgi:hypothetical protein